MLPSTLSDGPRVTEFDGPRVMRAAGHGGDVHRVGAHGRATRDGVAGAPTPSSPRAPRRPRSRDEQRHRLGEPRERVARALSAGPVVLVRVFRERADRAVSAAEQTLHGGTRRGRSG